MKQQELTAAQERSLRRAISNDYLAEETGHIRRLARQAKLLPSQRRDVEAQARDMVERLRKGKLRRGSLEAFMNEYDLSTQEGTVMMCMAEALLRIPDTATRDSLIHDSLVRGNWQSHLGHSDSRLVDAATWALMMSGRVVQAAEGINPLDSTFKRLLAKRGEPVIRESITQAMHVVGNHFVCGESIQQALEAVQGSQEQGYAYSFDMLGEAALTAEDATHYAAAYEGAIRALASKGAYRDLQTAPGISVKLSALHPRFEALQAERVRAELPEALLQLAQLAKEANISLTVDAEEADRLDLSLDVFAKVYRDPSLSGWEGLGLAVQAYQKRAPAVIEWLNALARDRGRRIPTRLVKGAYWDTEIKQAQRMGLAGYPVYTRKAHTDVSYMACVRLLFKCPGLFPQFATHNAHSIATVRTLAPDQADFEFQRLHGMAEDLYDPLVAEGLPCRVYAPVGSHKHLLAYLVRRLLENGANNSFINRLHKKRYSVSQLCRDPVEAARESKCLPHPNIPLPERLYGSTRDNAPGLDISQPSEQPGLARALERFKPVDARPLVPGWDAGEKPASTAIYNPALREQTLGSVVVADRSAIDQALDNAAAAYPRWNRHGVAARADILEQAAHRLILFQPKLATLLVKEAGKTWPAALAEVREAVDLCRYYAEQARRGLSPQNLPGPTGEENRYTTQGRGPMLCISPWNFPLAIFTGQIAAALVAGNPVIAKPAAQTPLLAFVVVRLLHRAGVPKSVLQLLTGSGERIAKRLLADRRLQGVLFTGSFATAQNLQRQIANRPGPIIPLIAETGGLNAMLVDSTALPEQVVKDTLRSAFDSAGQRCSALRILCLQEDIADDVEAMLAGAMAEIRVGDPGLLQTDTGPLIDAKAKTRVQRHLRRLRSKGRLIAEAALPADTTGGYFLAPQAWAIEDLKQVPNEVFGPILHVLRFKGEDFETLIDELNDSGYGLTSGLHSRIAARHEQYQQRMRAGNLYINRDMIAAVPGSQPFGGYGLSGTGPKAGGPHYLFRLVHEQTITTNTAAMGGNTSLLTIDD